MLLFKRKNYRILTLITIAIYVLSLLNPVLAADNQTYLSIDSNNQPTGSVFINDDDMYTNSTSVILTVNVHDDKALRFMEVGISSYSDFRQPTWQTLTKDSDQKDKTAKISWTLVTEQNGPQTVYVKFRKNNNKTSTLYSDQIIFDNIPPSTSASPAGGVYNTPQNVTLSASEDANIFYTLDGKNPVPNNNPYTDPININSDTTLKFIAVDGAGNASDVYTENYSVDSEAPKVTAEPNGGIFNSPQIVTLNASEKDATIYYTTSDTTTLDENSTLYSGPINIAQNTNLKFIAIDRAKNESILYTESYTIDTQAPTVSAKPEGGLYNGPQDVVLTPSETSKIYYTLDNNVPTINSNQYTGSIRIDSDKTLQYIAIDQADNTSETYSQIYTIDMVSPTANADIAAGIYNKAQTVNLTASEPGTIYYTTDGSEPSKTSTQYASPILIGATADLKFIAVDMAGNISQSYTVKYSIDTVKPTVRASVPGGIYKEAKLVSLTPSETADIYYTLDGTKPLPTSQKYEGPISISNEGVTTLKFAALDQAGNTSKVYTRIYTIDSIAPTVGADITGGLYNTSKLVTLTSSESGNIYYTVDGATPTVNSTKYTNPIEINSTTTVKFIAFDLAENSSSIGEESYTIDTTVPVITLAGNNAMTIEVGNSYSDPGYTATDNLDGNITGKVVVSGNIDTNKVGTYTVRYNLKDSAGNDAVEVTRNVNVILLNLTWPRDGAQLTDPQTTVSGHVKVGSSVKVNGQAAYPNAMGDFVKLLPMNLGENTITVTATDSLGNIDSKRITVNAPSVTVTAPANNLITAQNAVTITGKVADNTPLTINNNPVTADANGNFSATVDLIEGSNTITVSAGPTTVTRTVKRDSIAPTLTVTSPATDMNVSQSSLTVAGYAETGSSIKVNGQPAYPNASGYFCKIISLNLQSNTITVTSTDSAGNTTTVSRSVTRTQ